MARSKGTPNAGPRGIEEIGERDGWLCWLCDKPVDSGLSTNDDQGPSVDARMTKSKAKKKSAVAHEPRLAHRQCNTGKGNNDAVVEWSDALFVADPAPLIPSVERLSRKGGREAMARCLNQEDANMAADWLLDRLSRLAPELDCSVKIEPGGGQFLLVLSV